MSRASSLADELLKFIRQSGSPETWVDPMIVKYLAPVGGDRQKQHSELDALHTELQIVMARSQNARVVKYIADVVKYIAELKRRLEDQIDNLGSGTD